MSGTLIWGSVDETLTARRGFLDRLLGRGREPRVLDLGRDRTLIDLPTKSVQPLVPEFKAYVVRRTGRPWPATRAILDYLEIAMTLHLRGERRGDAPPIWYVQLTFGGCAGMADVSSAVAAHWASRWFAEEGEGIARLLRGSGFTPTRGGEPEDDLTYLPVGGLGYAAFRSTTDDDADEDSHGPFELDAAITEDDAAHADEILRVLDQTWASFMADGRCHCQFCDKSFDPRRLAADLPARGLEIR